MGLRYDDDLANRLFEGIETMKESTTYQSILREGRQEGHKEGETMGRVREAHRFLRLQGMRRFGTPSPAIDAVLEAIDDVDRLEALGLHIVEPELQGWDDLLQGS